ncbi:GMC family oxidoreductase [Acetobacter sp. AN02]|uniref:GMC family oxidoreductase n=1 Tax=Acetobacter sp. AN02 TaxID=2894186 RepID=UPI00243456F2|nr:GMC family oxidoreductase [Acetobacter sp. AN02]MDG6094272.1 GMC family oxidoreductase [Acetobacter sp. AN02]
MSAYDVCIIGAGLTGLLVARKFIESGKRVLLVERGGEYLPEMEDRNGWWREETVSEVPTPDGRILTRNTFDGAEELFPDLAACDTRNAPWNFQYNMWRGVGGSGQMWSGMAWRLAPHDFRLHDTFGTGRNWPISYEDISPYYDRAEALLEVSGPGADVAETYRYWPWKNNYAYPPFRLSYLDTSFQASIGEIGEIVMQPHAVRNRPASEGGCVGAKTCVSFCPTGAIFKSRDRLFDDIAMDDNLEIMVETCCLSLDWDEGSGRITGAILRERGSEEEIPVEADLFFLCANALENILLIRRSEVRTGKVFGKTSPQVGRRFSSHGAFTYSVLTDQPVFPVRGRPTHGSVIEWVDRTPEERRNGVTMEVWQSDFLRGYHPREHLEKDIAAGHWGVTLFRRMAEYERRFAISFVFETEMSDITGVSLSPDYTDAYGMPLPLVKVSLGENDENTISFIRRKVAEIAESPGIARLEQIGCGLNGNHPLGGLTMSDSAETGVVDRYGRSHDFSNLYITGGGAFCSTGSFNPTLTITALALMTLDDPRLGLVSEP